jgi:hypothetical protein
VVSVSDRGHVVMKMMPLKALKSRIVVLACFVLGRRLLWSFNSEKELMMWG